MNTNIIISKKKGVNLIFESNSLTVIYSWIFAMKKPTSRTTKLKCDHTGSTNLQIKKNGSLSRKFWDNKRKKYSWIENLPFWGLPSTQINKIEMSVRNKQFFIEYIRKYKKTIFTIFGCLPDCSGYISLFLSYRYLARSILRYGTTYVLRHLHIGFTRNP